jgi:hypothetical protein
MTVSVLRLSPFGFVCAVHGGEGDELGQGGQNLLVTGRAARRDDRHRYALSWYRL